MPLFRIHKQREHAEGLKEHVYRFEGKGGMSPQAIIANNPEIITGVSELELVNTEIIMTCREYNTASGPIDILLIGSNAEIIIIETKLLKNPDSTRKVVAQAIDYIKAFGSESVDSFYKKIEGSGKLFTQEDWKKTNFSALLDQNIKTGNFTVIVVGDYIHPNVLGMIESIQSAPHLAFRLFLLELDSYDLNEDEILIIPKIVAKTVEVERSVIRIEIDTSQKDYKIISETPDKKGKGTKPIISWDEYLQNITVNTFTPIIADFRKKWVADINDSINMGQVGFSAGVLLKGKRIPIQFVYDSRLEIVSERTKISYNIPDELYKGYLNEFKQSDVLYDKYIVGNKVFVKFEDIDEAALKLILSAAYKLGKWIKNIEDRDE